MDTYVVDLEGLERWRDHHCVTAPNDSSYFAAGPPWTNHTYVVLCTIFDPDHATLEGAHCPLAWRP